MGNHKNVTMLDGLSDQVDLAAPPKEGNDFFFLCVIQNVQGIQV